MRKEAVEHPKRELIQHRDQLVRPSRRAAKWQRTTQMNSPKPTGVRKRTKVLVAGLLVIGLAVFAHFLALFRMARCGRQFAFMDPITVRHIPLIDCVQAHPEYPVGYGLVFLAALWWLERRGAPGWLAWIAFVLLSVPALDYGWACLALGTRFAVYNP